MMWFVRMPASKNRSVFPSADEGPGRAKSRLLPRRFSLRSNEPLVFARGSGFFSILRIFTLWLALALPAAATAKDKMAIDPAAAYVLVEIEHLKDAVLKGTTAPGAITIARYDPVGGDVRGGDKSPGTLLGKKEVLRIVLGSKPVAKSKEARLYLVQVPADTWVIEGSGTTAFSLGSRTFTAAPGQIVDLGRFHPSVDWLEGEGPKDMASGLMGAAFFGSVNPKDLRPIKLDWRPRGASDFPLPPALAGKTLVAADYAEGAKFGNYLGGLVNRIGGRATRGQGVVSPVAPASDVAARVAADQSEPTP